MNRILFVEDDEALALGIEYTLQEEGYEVVRASTVKEGKAYFDKKDFDLVLLDINLPDGSGYDVCKYIKSIKDTPIIFLTALDEEVNVVLGLDMGGEDYITKPFRVRELLSRIKVALRRNSKFEKNSLIIKCEDIILNTAKIEVLKKNERLALIAKEYKLLLIFMKSPGVMLSKDEILNELFEDEGAFVEDNTLSVYIKRLREKIEENPSKPEYIITKRGLGYMWNKDIQ